MTDDNSSKHAYGVFKPVGHIVVVLPKPVDVGQAIARFAGAGIARDEMRSMTSEEMLRQNSADMEHAGVLARIGQDFNIVRSHRELALKGCSFLVIRAKDDATRDAIADVARQIGALRAQQYGRLAIEELIPVGDSDRQTPESPDLGLDAQTASGAETVDQNRRFQ